MTYGKDWPNGSDLNMTLPERLAITYPNTDVINLGVNADISGGVYTRRADVNIYNPKMVVVWIGINDITIGKTFNEITENLQKIYQYFKSQDRQVFAVTITPNDNDTSGQVEIKSDVNNWIKTVANVDRVIDAFSVISDPQDTTKRLAIYADPNTPNHINDAGMAAIVELFL